MNRAGEVLVVLWHRWHLSVTGVIVGALAAWASLMPSLLPRTWQYQGFVTGLSMLVGYGAGIAVRTVWKRLVSPRVTLGPALLDLGDRVVAFARLSAPYVLIVYLITATATAVRWQDQVSDLVASPRPPWSDYMRAPWVALAVFVVLLIACRVIQAAYRGFVLLVRRRFAVGENSARITGIVVVAALMVGVAQGVIPRAFFQTANRVFSVQNDQDLPGAQRPTASERSGGPGSHVDFEDLGRQGRRFVSGGLGRAHLSDLLREDAREPIRAYAGLESAPTDDERARLVVAELDRTRAWERGSVVIAPTTGTGWINPHAAQAIELLSGGDVALVGTQYSYLPSWISFLADREKAETAGKALIDAVVTWRDSLPSDRQRPALYVYGESLGTQAGEAAFSGLRDIRATVDGVLWLGPPHSNRIWSSLVERRDPGTRAAEPVYADGLLVRFSEDPAEFRGDDTSWIPPRVLYVQHATDPVVWWTTDLLFARPDWLTEPPGRGRHPGMRYLPVVTFFQVTADLGNAIGGSQGYGHLYDRQILDGWAAATGRPGWDEDEFERFARLHATAMEHQERG
ncbi:MULTISPECIES: alpha/beta-hydrolase family protein [unclassified Dietzia]|uniref:alpha/beta hydrolase n=1 Tax=unclassified Dietzia TaxID=2617939 RepID=UPI001E317D95|nr:MULTISPECIES: alpha/beta hydrolase [unclassified Dietzia]